MSDADFFDQARRALSAWGVQKTPRLIKNRENVVFEAVGPEGQRTALRLHRPGYQSKMAIRSELWWSEALADGGMLVPRAIRTRAGDVLVELPERVASMVSWVDGSPMGEGGALLAMPEHRQEALHVALGRELARLHNLSDAATLPEAFERPVMDAEALLGDAPAWGRFWENPSLMADEVALLQKARHRLSDILSSATDFGLIHADALRENVMVDGDSVHLIDFDDGVFGYRLYELGVAMSQNWDQPNRDALGAALLDGYQQLRPLPTDAHALLQAFTVLRGLASCGWVIGRYPADHPATHDYAHRAVEMTRAWVV